VTSGRKGQGWPCPRHVVGDFHEAIHLARVSGLFGVALAARSTLSMRVSKEPISEEIRVPGNNSDRPSTPEVHLLGIGLRDNVLFDAPPESVNRELTFSCGAGLVVHGNRDVVRYLANFRSRQVSRQEETCGDPSLRRLFSSLRDPGCVKTCTDQKSLESYSSRPPNHPRSTHISMNRKTWARAPEE
jgi:hypothetical protein